MKPRTLYMSVSEAAFNKVSRAHNALGALADLHANIADKAMGSNKDGCAKINAEHMADLIACVQFQLRHAIKSGHLA
jgi:hypothetical protein